MSAGSDYASLAEELSARIYALIPEQPAILELNDVWRLFKIPGFHCDDLGPSMYQASWALNAAKVKWFENHLALTTPPSGRADDQGETK
jgi:hypothetical protein